MPNFPNLTFDKICEIHAKDRRNQPRFNWNKLVDATPNGLDLEREEHLASLHLWLNRLKCRLPSRSSDSELVRNHLLAWWRQWLPLIIDLQKFDLLALPESHLSEATRMFQDLQGGKIESKRARPFGPVAASKTLMAVNPNIFAAWDEKIASTVYGGNTSMHFREHLLETQLFARTVLASADLSVLLEPLNRIGIGKIVDEALYWAISV